MTTANIVLSAKDTTRAAFASLEASARGAGQRLDALNGTVQSFLALGAVTAFTAGLASAINELDRLGDTAPKIGLTSQSLAELGFAAKLSGTDTATLEGAIGKLSTRMTDAAGGSKEAAAVFNSLGIKVKDAAGNLKSGDKVLGEIADKFATFTDGPERAALAVEIFGKSGRELIPLLIQGSQGIDGLRSEFRALAGDDLTAAAQAAGVFNDNLDRLQASTGKFSREVLEATLPILNGLVSGFIDTKKGIEEVNPVAEALATILETVAVVGANVAFVLKSIRDNVGGYAALIFAEAELKDSIYESIKADDEARRRQLDNFEKRILGARELSKEIASIDKSYQALEDRRLRAGGPEKTTAPVITKAGPETQSAYKSISDELQKQIGLAAEQERLGRQLLDSEKFRIEINQKINGEKVKLTAAERASLGVQAEFAIAQKEANERRSQQIKLAQQAYAAEVEFEDERARAEVEASKARESTRSYVQDIVLATEEQTRLLELEASLVNATEQQRGFALEKLRIELQLRKDILEVQRRLQFDAVAQQKAIDRLNADAQAKIANAQKRSILDEFNRTTAQISDSLTDALLRGFESGKGFVRNFVDTLKNLFKTLVLTPTIKAIIQPVAGALTGALGVAGPANAATGSNLLSTASNAYSLANIGSTFASTAGALGGVAGAEFAANFIGAVGGDAIGALATGLQASGAVAGSAFASAALQAVPYVAAAAVVASALGLFRSKKIVDGGLQGELGGQINDYALQRRGGSLFSGPSYSVLDQGVSAQNDELQKAYSAIRNTVAGMAEQLGIGNDAIKAFTVQLGNDLIHPDTGGFGIKTQGLSQDEILKKIEAALQSANEQLAAFALGTAAFTRDGETAVQTLAGLTGSLQTFNGTFKLLGLTLADTSLAGADATRTFIESFGGAEQFAQVTSSFYQNFYTEAERTANTVEALRQRFFELGTAGATTREGFRALVEEQQRLHGATAPVVAELLKLESTFASVVPSNEALIKSERELAEARAKAAAEQEVATAAYERAGRLAAERARQSENADRRMAIYDQRAAPGGSYGNSVLSGLTLFTQEFGNAADQAAQVIPEWLTSFEQIQNLFLQDLISAETMDAWSAGLTTLRTTQGLAAGALTEVVQAFGQVSSWYGNMRESVVARYTDSNGNFNRERPNGVFTDETIHADNIAFDSNFYGGHVEQALGLYQREAIATVARTLEVVAGSSANAAQKIAFLTGTLAQLDSLSLGTSDSADALRAAIAELDGTVASVADRVADAEQALRGAYKTQANELQQVIEKQKEYAAAIKEYRLGLDTSAAALLSPEAQYAAAREALQSATPQDFTRLADAFLDASRGYNASSSAYFGDIAAVKELAQNAEINALATADVSQLQLTALEAQVSSLITINESVLSVEQAIAALAAARGTPIPGFASGGDFGGGLRIVGERGIELEATGPSRIFNASQTRQILSGGGDGGETAREVKELRGTIVQMGRMLQTMQARLIAQGEEANELRMRMAKDQKRVINKPSVPV